MPESLKSFNDYLKTVTFPPKDQQRVEPGECKSTVQKPKLKGMFHCGKTLLFFITQTSVRVNEQP